MAKIYVNSVLGTKVQQLRHYFDVVTASDKGIIMLTRDDWNKVCEYISNIDQGTSDKGIELSFFAGGCLWAECFFVCCYDDEKKSFHAIANHHTFVKVCRACHVQPILLEVSYNIPFFLNQDLCGGKPVLDYNFEIEVEDN